MRIALVRGQRGWLARIGSRSDVGLNSLPNSSCVFLAKAARVFARSWL